MNGEVFQDHRQMKNERRGRDVHYPGWPPLLIFLDRGMIRRFPIRPENNSPSTWLGSREEKKHVDAAEKDKSKGETTGTAEAAPATAAAAATPVSPTSDASIVPPKDPGTATQSELKAQQ